MNGFVGTYAVKSEGIAATHCKEVGGGSSDKSKKKMKSALKDKRTEDERFSGTFADYMNQLQEKTEEREQRKLKERMEKEAALKAKKKEDLEKCIVPFWAFSGPPLGPRLCQNVATMHGKVLAKEGPNRRPGEPISGQNLC